MAIPYSDDFRDRLVRSIVLGYSCRETARLFAVSVVKWSQRRRAIVSAAARKRPQILESEHAWLLARLVEQPEPMVRALTIELAERGDPVSPNTVWVLLRRTGTALKKRCPPPSRTDRRSPR